MRIDPEISGVGIVVLGSFNPAIFTPAWFALHGLLPKSVADSADLKVAHQQITEFVYDWLHLQVMTGRFSVDTRQAPHTRPGDLVVRIFGEHLSHTPLSAFGINRRVHFRVRNAADRDRLGRLLAPTEPSESTGEYTFASEMPLIEIDLADCSRRPSRGGVGVAICDSTTRTADSSRSPLPNSVLREGRKEEKSISRLSRRYALKTEPAFTYRSTTTTR